MRVDLTCQIRNFQWEANKLPAEIYDFYLSPQATQCYQRQSHVSHYFFSALIQKTCILNLCVLLAAGAKACFVPNNDLI